MRFPNNFFPSPVVPDNLVSSYCALADRLVRVTVEQYEAFSALPPDQRVDPTQWKETRKKDNLTLHKERRTRATQPYHIMETLRGDEPVYTKAYVPNMLMTGSIEGRLEDACFGTFIDTTESLRMRERYSEEDVAESQVLQRFRGPSFDDPFHFTGITWLILGNTKIPLVRRRDVLLLHSVGLTKLTNGEPVGYCLYHCVELPNVPQLTNLKMIRVTGSYCYIRRQTEIDRIDVYLKGWFTPLGEIPEFLVISNVMNSLLATQNTVKIAYIRKLLHQIQASRSKEVTRVTEIAACTSCCSGGCTSNFIKYGGKFGSCILCRMPVCALCVHEQKVIVEINEDGVITRKLTCCLPCLHKIRVMSAYEVAREQIGRKPSHSISSTASTTSDAVEHPTSLMDVAILGFDNFLKI